MERYRSHMETDVLHALLGYLEPVQERFHRQDDWYANLPPAPGAGSVHSM